ncbi:KH domain protein [Ancylostoma duodenale]|uniref:KH domain protein n=1 Tax=Ancylostoma duodenale TaxID=51022 RepID=A0A0C2FGG0_9BILA|nr:KH domain protein [Ancylostoma duodenale]
MSAVVKVVDITHLIDKRHIGMFIGKKGCNLKRIETETKVIVQIEKEDEENAVKIRLTGLPMAVEAAQIEVYELALQILRQSFCHSTKIPSRCVGPLIGKYFCSSVYYVCDFPTEALITSAGH